MPRAARIIHPDTPHHVTQRGNHRAPIFFEPDDHTRYLAILAEQVRRFNVEVWAYCLMPNHVHLVLTPSDETGFSRAIGETHRRYAMFINKRLGWKGHLFESRFASIAMTERHLCAAFRYVSMNPVRAGLVADTRDWPWSSVHAHLQGRDDGLVLVRPLLDRIEDVERLLEPDPRVDVGLAPDFDFLRGRKRPAVRTQG